MLEAVSFTLKSDAIQYLTRSRVQKPFAPNTQLSTIRRALVAKKKDTNSNGASDEKALIICIIHFDTRIIGRALSLSLMTSIFFPLRLVKKHNGVFRLKPLGRRKNTYQDLCSLRLKIVFHLYKHRIIRTI